MRILFMATPEFSVKSLEVLFKSEHNIVGVMTMPDKPRGRGHKVSSSPVKIKALELNLPVYEFEKLHNKEFKDLLDELKPELIITACYAHYINKWIREYPLYGSINLHPSLLPLYRGTSPIIEPIMRGDEKTGITTFYLDRGWDTGDIIVQREIPIEVCDTGGSLHDKLSILGSEVLLETVNLIAEGKETRNPQDHSKACYTDKIFPHHGEIDWTDKAVNIERKIKAYNPVPGTFTFYNQEKFKIWKSSVYDDKNYVPGTIIHATSRTGFIVGTGQGALEIITLQLPSKKKLDAKEFLRGYKIEEGAVLGVEKKETPSL